jgi:hypothetical protein
MTTTLDVLNHMLNVIGESPVSTVSSDHPSVLAAMVELNRVKREMQTRGWWFNTEYNLKLIPNELGQILIPTDTLYIDPVDAYSHLVRRGGKLYDPVKHTFIIDTSVIVNAVLLLPVEDLPESAAMYVMHKSAYDFYVNDDGDETKSNRLEKQVDRAWAVLQSEELRVSNLNAKNRPQVAQLRYRMRQSGVNYDPRWPGGRV